MSEGSHNQNKKLIGGSIFVRNAIKFGYCITEALDSLYALCDQISILECGSDDGTEELIRGWVDAHQDRDIIYTQGHKWDVAKDYRRLAILANVAREKLSTPWHFMLQADEVLHERSIPVLRHLAEHGKSQAYLCRRLNLFVTPDTFVRLDSQKKPCGDALVRFARLSCLAIGDAEGLGVHNPANQAHLDDIVIFHYGYVREGQKHIDKAIDMQGWFFGPGSTPDQRIVAMRSDGNKFKPEVFFGKDDLSPIPMPHPVFSAAMAERLRSSH
jgi:hypothetical protein